MIDSIRNREILYTDKDKERAGFVRFFCVLALVVLAIFSFRVWWTANYAFVEVDGLSMYPTFNSKAKISANAEDDKVLMHYGSDAKRGDIIIVDVRKYAWDSSPYAEKDSEFNLDDATANDARYSLYPEEFYLSKYDEVSRNASTKKTVVRRTEFLIKRLIGIEGDKIYCKDGKVFICYVGETEFVQLSEPYAYSNRSYSFGSPVNPYVVGEGEIFFLGDNRTDSMDSRWREGKSHIRGLYKAEDIYGTVPEWAVSLKNVLKYIPGLG